MTMKDRRHAELGDEQFEEMVRGLPRREPRPGLRDSLFARLAAPRSIPSRRPRLALGLLAALVLADVLVLRSGGGTPPVPDRVVAASQEEASEEAALLADLGVTDAPLRLALRPAPRESAAAEERRLLEELNGG
jgi:hypothetical protein